MDLTPENIFGLLRSTDEFPVDFEDAWQWIGYTRKDSALKRLKKNFILGVDYVDDSEEFSAVCRKNLQAGRPSDLFFLTVDCFKSFAMMAGTDRGREVRKYFLDCEKHLKVLTQQQRAAGVTLDQQWSMWQQRYDIRIDLKDRLRPELMSLTAKWAEGNGRSPQTVCSDVHDAMNERIQGIKSRTIKSKTGLSLADLIRDYFGTKPLAVYSAINTLAINFVNDDDMAPLDAVHRACDAYLSRGYLPKPVPMIENLYVEGAKLKSVRRQKRLQAGIQMSLFDQLDQAS